VNKYLPDHCRILNTGDDLDLATTFTAGFDIYVKYPFQSLGPGHRYALLRGSLRMCFCWCYEFFAFTPLGWCYQHSVFAIGCEYAMKAGQMDSWFRYQGDQPGDEIQWFEYHMGRTVAPG